MVNAGLWKDPVSDTSLFLPKAQALEGWDKEDSIFYIIYKIIPCPRWCLGRSRRLALADCTVTFLSLNPTFGLTCPVVSSPANLQATPVGVAPWNSRQGITGSKLHTIFQVPTPQTPGLVLLSRTCCAWEPGNCLWGFGPRPERITLTSKSPPSWEELWSQYLSAQRRTAFLGRSSCRWPLWRATVWPSWEQQTKEPSDDR